METDMKHMTRYLLAIALVALPFHILLSQVKLPAPSPLQTLTQKVGYADLELRYSRPLSRGREIFGNLVPYDVLWRMGANQCTTISLSQNAVIGGKKIEAGKYSLLGIPGEKEWTIILNSKTEKFWPPSGYEPELNIHEFKVKPTETKQLYSELAYQFVDIDFEKAVLRLNWEHTQVEFELRFDTDAKASKLIAEALKSPENLKRGDYNNIATYYALSGKNLDQALEMYDQFIAKSKRPPYWVMFHKAELLARMDRKAEAISLAEEVIEISKQDKVWGPKYADWSAKLIKRLKK
ncbi:MAG: DUF2911 domain-containing protein [Opitutales bacterium]|nr:DUF2911 domain-containing protein [Opitutales bacterium]